MIAYVDDDEAGVVPRRINPLPLPGYPLWSSPVLDDLFPMARAVWYPCTLERYTLLMVDNTTSKDLEEVKEIVAFSHRLEIEGVEERTELMASEGGNWFPYQGKPAYQTWGPETD